MRKVNRTGRSKGSGRFVMLTHHMLGTEAWRALTPQARAVYVEIVHRFHGNNNGRIALGVRDAAETCNISKDTAAKCFRELEALGFIELAKPGSFTTKVRHAQEWRLTEKKCDVSGKLPSRAFQHWQSPATDAERNGNRS